MVRDYKFTFPANAMNLAAGVLFAATFLKLLLDSLRQEGWALYLLGAIALLCAVAGLSFPFSETWSHAWWFHHLLRFCAFLAAFVVVLLLYRQSLGESEELLRESLVFRQLVEHSSQGCGLASLDGTVTYINPSLARMVKLAHPEDALGHPIVPFYPEELQEQVAREVIPTVQEKGSWNGESALRATDGTVVPILESFFLVRDEQGTPLCLGDIMLDITEWKRSQEALQASEERMRTFLDNTGDLVTQVDRNGNLLFVNNAARKVYGLDPQECVGKAVFDFVLPEDRERTRQAFEGWIDSREAQVRFENRQQAADGTVSEISWTVNPQYDDAGALVHVWSVGHDVTKRNRAASEAARANTLNEQMITSMPGVFYLFDETLHFQRWNRNMETVSGYTSAQLGEMSPLALFDEEEGERVAERIAEVFSKGHSSVKAEMLARDGTRHPFLFSGVHVVLDGKNCVIGQGIDIRDERRLESLQRLRQKISESFLKEDSDLFPSVLDAILNETGSRLGMFGYLDEGGAMVYPTLSQDVWEACRMEDRALRFPRESWGGIWGRSLAERKTLVENSPLSVPEGHIEIVNAMTTPILHADQLVGHLQVANKDTDYTDEDIEAFEYVASYIGPILQARLEQKQAEEALEAERDRLSSLFDSIEDVIYVSDPETYELLFVNRALAKTWGKDVMGRKCHKVLQNRDAPCPFCTNDKIFGDYLGKTYIWEFRNEITGRWYRCCDKAIPWAKGKMVRYEVASDVTDEKILAREQIRLEKFSAIGQLAAGVAHELNNPLMGVINFAQYSLSRTDPGDERHELLQDIVEETRRCVSIVGSLLSASRIDDAAGGEKTRFKPVSVVDGVVRLLEYRVSKEGISVRVTAQDNVPEITMSRDAFQQLCINLLTNAIDAVESTERKEIRVDLKSGSGSLTLKVVDTGCGMPKDAGEKIFDPFFTTKPPGKGTGLGLATCWKIVKSGGGTLHWESMPGSGTEMKITLPLEPPDAEPFGAVKAG